jgi:hypothetical protein
MRAAIATRRSARETIKAGQDSRPKPLVPPELAAGPFPAGKSRLHHALKQKKPRFPEAFL